MLKPLALRLSLALLALYAYTRFLLPASNGSISTDTHQLDLSIAAYTKDLLKQLTQAHTLDNERIHKIKRLQEHFLCYIHRGTWIIQGQLNSRYYPNKSCLPVGWPSLEHLQLNQIAGLLCTQFAGKRLLFVGPRAFHHVHTLFLQAIAEYDGKAYTCKAAENCGHHFVCGGPQNRELPPGSIYKPPPEANQTQPNLAHISFVLSDTLSPPETPQSENNARPFTDPQTAVRRYNTNWFSVSRRAQVLVLNKGPIPAPAWTHDGSTGNWSFARDLPQDPYSPQQRSLTAIIINAARHVVFQTYLPEIFYALEALQQVTKPHKIFLGSWYQQPTCTNAGLTPEFRTTELVWENTTKQAPRTVDPWSLYYNTQIYIIDKLLLAILPHFNVTFVPMTIPLIPDSHGPENQRNANGRKDCLRPNPNHPMGEAIQTVLMKSLEYLSEDP